MGEESGKNDGPDGPTGGAADTLDLRGSLGARLKALYQALEQEPIPELFIDLLQKLDEAEAAPEGAPIGRVPV
ncbi:MULTISPECIES: NepR family anti-sigma factor [unclassified Ensifer]|uniref:NepR family anti-sigma factor n=1 Tax=unclassified Ensifer TaxID=2633371 RepID=UPI00081352BF|nr:MULTISPECIES: NepR family anti-sigma factor [unclassified Ensifer]OCP04866.1 hypothetical protein BC362_13925 [Ensifer sp. LC14]OCP08771.1 hypothetical protein BBX50_19480 [Ensifer sp. LC11]OCP10034.1 hypothetical protein BC374_19270 [Ensifer sp. LC13]OCP33061.1 hypothetical protein BC364_18255 [Ensifer sp. LC499]